MKTLTPYDLGTVLEPKPWGPTPGEEDNWGKVDFDNDEGGTDATLRVAPSEVWPGYLDIEIETNQNVLVWINGVRYFLTAAPLTDEEQAR